MGCLLERVGEHGAGRGRAGGGVLVLDSTTRMFPAIAGSHVTHRVAQPAPG